MADNTPLLASLLMGQKQDDYNPFATQRKYGRDLIIKGASTAPLQSGNWLEGLARALTGVAGGYFAGEANRDEDAQNAHNTSIYAQAAAEKDPLKASKLLEGLKGADPQRNALFGQIIQNNINEGLKQQSAGGVLTRGGGVGGDVLGAPPGGGLNIDITRPTQSGGGNNPNNVGNIGPGRQYATPQAGAADLAQLLQSYPVKYNNGQPMTLRQIARIYAPADDGQNPALRGNNPDQWAMNVGSRSGIHPDTPLDFDNPAVMTRVVGGINPAEKAPGDVQPPEVLRQGVQQGMDGAPPPKTQQQAPPVQTAQAGGPPAQMQLPQVPPAPDAVMYWKQAQQFASQGDNVKAVEYKQKALEAQAKFAANLQEGQAKIGMQGTEHDRQQNTATPVQYQSQSAAFADKMQQAQAALGNLEKQGLSGKGALLGSVPLVGNYAQTPEYQTYTAAKEAFLNSQLRSESGANINSDEFKRAERQYFPQPGDGPDAIQQKAIQRDIAIKAMARSAGPTYQPGTNSGPPAAAAPQATSKAMPKTEAEYNALPSGTHFTAPDGSERVKP